MTRGVVIAAVLSAVALAAPSSAVAEVTHEDRAFATVVTAFDAATLAVTHDRALRVMPCEQADAGEPLVSTDPDDPAAQAVRHAARGLVAMFPVELPILQAAAPAAPAPAPSRMSLPMAG